MLIRYKITTKTGTTVQREDTFTSNVDAYSAKNMARRALDDGLINQNQFPVVVSFNNIGSWSVSLRMIPEFTARQIGK